MADLILPSRPRADLTLPARPRVDLEGGWPEASRGISVILIVLDDVGPDQLECYDDVNLWHADTTTPEYHYPETTWISALAARGVRCNYAYASPVCSPTRAQILTGRYPHTRAGHQGTGIGIVVNAGGDSKLLATHYAFPLILSALDTTYDSIAEGKWHLGYGQGDPMSPIDAGGFDIYKGCLTNPGVENDSGGYYGSYYNWFRTIAYKVPYGYTQVYKTDTFLSTGEFGGLSTFVKAATQPFVAVWNAHSAHSVLDVIEDDAGPATGATTNITRTFSEDEQDVTTEDRNLYLRRQHSHLEAMDILIGELEKDIPADLQPTTIFVLVGDNGTAAGGIATSADDFWGQGEEPPDNRYDSTHMKGQMYDGGIHVPLIIGGDMLDASVKGTSYNHPVDVVDIMPTIMDLIAGGWRGYMDSLGLLSEIDGVSLTPLLSGGRTSRSHSLAQRFAPNGSTIATHTTYEYAVMNEHRWKLIVSDGDESLFYLGGTNGDDHSAELENVVVVADPLEATDLIAYCYPPLLEPAIWEEYNDLKLWLDDQILTTEEKAVLGPVRIPVTLVAVETGTVEWSSTFDEARRPSHCAVGNSGGHVIVLHGSDSGITTATHCSLYAMANTTPPTALWTHMPHNLDASGPTITRIAAARNADLFATLTRDNAYPLQVSGDYYLNCFKTTSTAGPEWTWVDVNFHFGNSAGWLTVSDDGSKIITFLEHPSSGIRHRLRVYGSTSSTPVLDMASPYAGASTKFGVDPTGSVAALGPVFTGFYIVKVADGTVSPYREIQTIIGSQFYFNDTGSRFCFLTVYAASPTPSIALQVWDGTTPNHTRQFVLPLPGTGVLNPERAAISGDGNTIATAVVHRDQFSVPMYRIAIIDYATQSEVYASWVPAIGWTGSGTSGVEKNACCGLSLNTDGTTLLASWTKGPDLDQAGVLMWTKTGGVWTTRETLYWSPGTVLGIATQESITAQNYDAFGLTADWSQLALIESGEYNTTPGNPARLHVLSLP